MFGSAYFGQSYFGDAVREQQRIIKYIEENYESVKHTDTPGTIGTKTVLSGVQKGK